jgi:hypothetical protein
MIRTPQNGARPSVSHLTQEADPNEPFDPRMVRPRRAIDKRESAVDPSAQFTPKMMPKRRPDHTTPVRSESSGFTLSGHAAQQARAKGWTEDDVINAANNPSIAYDNGRFPGQKRHIRGDLVAVVHPESRKVVTVYQNVKETDVRPDQSDEDAQRYARRRGGV